MENYREKLKIDNIITGICAFILAMFCVLNMAGEADLIPWFTPVAGDSHWHSMWRGFSAGASFGILAVMVFFIVRNALSLHNDNMLKKLYIRENDERTIQICTSARAAAMQAFLLIGLVAVIISGYFSIIVSLTILACVFTSIISGLLFKIYYSKKF